MSEEDEKEILLVWGLHIDIRPRESASQRTKNRLIEKGDEGFLVQSSPPEQPCKALHNRKSILVVAASDGARRGDRWVGWLPMDEISIRRWEEK